ncbi:zinc-ribbon domain-containing protein [Peribacillus butanolivorans]|uniref:zinc-ribbon domain-containing protein n=1 Tax=Peribacillus butanolivorans TaxID=421767 RepID=UPI0037F37E99
MKKNLASEYPEKVNEWDYELNGDIKPSEVPPKGRHHIWWKCKEGHPSYRAKLASRSNRTGIPPGDSLPWINAIGNVQSSG